MPIYILIILEHEFLWWPIKSVDVYASDLIKSKYDVQYLVDTTLLY